MWPLCDRGLASAAVAELRRTTGWPARVFRWAVTGLTVAIVTLIFLDWLDLRQQLHRYAGQDTFGSYSHYVIVHTNSSLQTHLFLAGAVALGVVQIAIVWAWQARLAAHWWVPPVVEVVLCVSLGFAASYAAGHYAVDCIGGGSTCGVLVHSLHHAWLAVWAVAGLLIGLLWTFSRRTPGTMEVVDQHSKTLVGESLA
jgi:hypothetical protein